LRANWILLTSLSYICLTIFGIIISYLRYIIYGVSIFDLMDLNEFLLIGVRQFPFFIFAAINYCIYLWWIYLLIKLVIKIINIFKRNKIHYTFKKYKYFYIWCLVGYLILLCFFNISLFESFVNSEERLIEVSYTKDAIDNVETCHLLGFSKDYLLVISKDNSVAIIPHINITKVRFLKTYKEGSIYTFYRSIVNMVKKTVYVL